MSDSRSTPYDEESYIRSILSLISPDMHAAAEKDLRFMLTRRPETRPLRNASLALDLRAVDPLREPGGARRLLNEAADEIERLTSPVTQNLKVRVRGPQERDGRYDLYMGETFLGRYDLDVLTPLANAIGSATGEYK